MKKSIEPTIWQKNISEIWISAGFLHVFTKKNMRPSRNPKSVSWAPRLQVAADPHLRSLQKLGYVVKYQGVWSLWNSNITINLYTHNHHYDLIWNLKTMVGISNIRRRQRVPTSPPYMVRLRPLCPWRVHLSKPWSLWREDILVGGFNHLETY